MPTEKKEEHLVRCVLCGGQCSFDCRVYHREAGRMSLLFGWLAFPVLGVLLGKLVGGAYYLARKVEPRAEAAPEGGTDAQRGD